MIIQILVGYGYPKKKSTVIEKEPDHKEAKSGPPAAADYGDPDVDLVDNKDAHCWSLVKLVFHGLQLSFLSLVHDYRPFPLT